MRSLSCSLCRLPVTPQHGRIIVHGARAHNLKAVCFEIPKNRLVALTGLSGSGKSSIAVDVLANECVRQLLGGYGLITDHIPKPRVDSILGLSPAITVSQRKSDFNSRSLVGTKTGILTLLRNLFATIGHQPCTGCGVEVSQPLEGKHKLVTIETEEKSANSTSTKKRKKSYFGCPHCGEQLEMLQMSHFSINAASGICESCKGLGEILDIDLKSLINGEKALVEGGIRFWDKKVSEYYAGVIEAASKHYNFSFDRNLPLKQYPKETLDFLLYGMTFPDFVKAHSTVKPPKKAGEGKFDGVIPPMLHKYKTEPKKAPPTIVKYLTSCPCPSCNNARLGRLGREVKIGGKNISEVAGLSISEFLEWLEGLETILPKEELQSYDAFSTGLQERAKNLIEVGLHYLALDRTIPSLSGGESQRLRLADALGSSALTGVLYILDEPTTGLHPHDTAKLLRTLRKMQENDNTVMVIEHDPDIIASADYIIDVGPGRGTNGGEIVVSGTPTEVMDCEKSFTGKHLSRNKVITLDPPSKGDGKSITIRGASENNLKNIDVSIPTQQLVLLTGVSGSGKSTLFRILDTVMRNHLNGSKDVPGKHVSTHGLDNVNRVVTVNQSTIGSSKSSRSNIATYTKLFDLIRGLFASLPDSKKQRFDANAFSFNASDERCENCNGAGVVQVDMSFMPGVEMDCPSCGGMRFNEDLLAVKFAGRNIAEILDLTISEAIQVFGKEKKILEILQLMQQVGLEHLKLGQSTSTLSGGEAQRIKFASELVKTNKEKTLFLLDEPTTGLHCEEIEILLSILRKLVSKGHTVVVIEHNLDAMCKADTIIDFGPGGGSAGGTIVAKGTVQEVCNTKASITGQCLHAYISGNSVLSLGSEEQTLSHSDHETLASNVFCAKKKEDSDRPTAIQSNKRTKISFTPGYTLATKSSCESLGGKDVSNVYWYEDNDVLKILKSRIALSDYQKADGTRIHILGPLDNISPYGLVETLTAHHRQPGVILIPFNLGQLHWVGLVLQYDANQHLICAEYYDPQGNAVPDFLNEMLHSINKGNDPIIFTPVQNERLIRQTNRNDCGPCMIENLLSAVGYKEDENTDSVARRLRHLVLLELADASFYAPFYERQRLNQSSFMTSKSASKLDGHFGVIEYKALLSLALKIFKLPENLRDSFANAIKINAEMQVEDECETLSNKIRSVLEPQIYDENVSQIIKQIFYFKEGMPYLHKAPLKLDLEQIRLLSLMLDFPQSLIEADVKEIYPLDKGSISKVQHV